jgi:hypothetical protein
MVNLKVGGVHLVQKGFPNSNFHYHEYNRDGKVSLKWLWTERYEKNLTFLGTYYIGTCITVWKKNVRTMKPFLVGLTLLDEMEMDI